MSLQHQTANSCNCAERCVFYPFIPSIVHSVIRSSIRASVCLSVRPSVHLSIHPSIHTFAHLLTHSFVHLFLHLFMCLLIFFWTIRLPLAFVFVSVSFSGLLFFGLNGFNIYLHLSAPVSTCTNHSLIEYLTGLSTS